MSLPTWTEFLVTVYTATGDLLQALACAGVSPNDYYTLLETVPAFGQRMTVARRDAHRTAAGLIVARALPREAKALAPEIADAVCDRGMSDGEFLRRVGQALACIRREAA